MFVVLIVEYKYFFLENIDVLHFTQEEEQQQKAEPEVEGQTVAAKEPEE